LKKRQEKVQATLEEEIAALRKSITEFDLTMNFPLKRKKAPTDKQNPKGKDFIKDKRIPSINKHTKTDDILVFLNARSDAVGTIDSGLKDRILSFPVDSSGSQLVTVKAYESFKGDLGTAYSLQAHIVVKEQALKDLTASKDKTKEKIAKSSQEREDIPKLNNTRVAIENLAEVYRLVSASNGNISEFVNRFIYRPIVTMEQSLSFFKFAFGSEPIPELRTPRLRKAIDLRAIPASFANTANPIDPRPLRRALILEYLVEVQRGAAFG
jgi:hypothetical protein